MLKSLGLPSTRSAMLPATRCTPRSLAQELAAAVVGPVQRLGAVSQDVRIAQHVPLLGQDEELGAVGGGRADEALGGLQVAGLVGR